MVWATSLIAVALLISCGSSSNQPKDGGGSAGDAGNPPDASTTLPATFRFAVVGDTRPPNVDDTQHFPTAVITKVWADVEAASPHPDFAVATGDYMFASTSGGQAAPQLDLYLTARNQFRNALFPVLGNHECTGATASNCGPGSANGVTSNYTAFMTKMLQPFGITEPYYAVTFHAADNAWSMKLVVVAANAWNPTQATWLDGALAQPTTYTFVIRHEDDQANTAPGVTPSATIIAKYPVTLKIFGHTHTYAHYASEHAIICGNGGAPLTSGTNYGYALVDRVADGTILVTEHDYQSNSVLDQFLIHADGSPAP
jgi:hypothetical protein